MIAVPPSAGRGVRRLWWLAACLFAAFTATFLLAVAAGVEDEAVWRAWLAGLAGSRAVAGATVVGVLVGDLVLPVPSSLVMTWAGFALGPVGGALSNAVGALGGALLGFGLCRWLGRAAFARLVGPDELPAVQAHFDRYGAWLIVLSRPVPMLTEVVSCLAGLSGMPLGRFLGLSAAGTLPLAVLYAWVGSRAETAEAAGGAVLIAVIVPALGLAIARRRGLV